MNRYEFVQQVQNHYYADGIHASYEQNEDGSPKSVSRYAIYKGHSSLLTHVICELMMVWRIFLMQDWSLIDMT